MTHAPLKLQTMSWQDVQPPTGITAFARPLSSSEAAAAESLAARIQAELRTLVAVAQPELRSTRPLSRLLGVDRTICHRVLTATSPAVQGVDVLGRLPGIRGLHTFVLAFGAFPVAAGAVQNALSAISEFERFIKGHARSHAHLIERVRATTSPTSDPLNEAAREGLFRHAAALTGRRLDLHLMVGVLRPLPPQNDRLESVSLTGFIGQQSREDAAPFAVGFECVDAATESQAAPDDPRLDDQISGLPGGGIISRFSTRPLPVVSVRPTAKGAEKRILDPRGLTLDRKVDIVIGARHGPFHDVRRDPEPYFNEVVRVRYPAERLLIDAYLHRSLAREATPSVAAFHSNPMLGDNVARIWDERVPGRPRLELLGGGLSGISTDAWARHAEATAFLFERLKLDPDDFVGFRCDVRFPIWQAYYYMTFDFSRPDEAGGST